MMDRNELHQPQDRHSRASKHAVVASGCHSSRFHSHHGLALIREEGMRCSGVRAGTAVYSPASVGSATLRSCHS